MGKFMNKKIGRNDPCPCGSGKKYKSCCMQMQKKPVTGKKTFKATLLSNPAPINLMERTYGSTLHATENKDTEGFVKADSNP